MVPSTLGILSASRVYGASTRPAGLQTELLTRGAAAAAIDGENPYDYYEYDEDAM